MKKLNEDNTDMHMKKAFIIWTPLHLYNVISYVLSRGLAGTCDAYYICQSEGMRKYLQSIENKRLFHHIYYTTEEKLFRNNRIWELESILISSKPYVKHMFGEGSTGNIYEQIFMSVPTRLNDAIIRANKCGEVVGYDDGTGSYVTNLYNLSLGRKYEFIKRLMKKPGFNVKQVFLNNPDSNSHIQDGLKYEKLLERKLTKDEKELIKNAFSYDSTSSISKYIYLNQPKEGMSNPEKYKEIERALIKTIKKELLDEITVRIHPREKDVEEYSGFRLDLGANMWELICSEELTDNNVLIGTFSTAQFTPKLLFNKEPWLIFTFDMFPMCYDARKRDEMRDLVKRIKDNYSAKFKVLVISSDTELKNAIIGLRGLSNSDML